MDIRIQTREQYIEEIETEILIEQIRNKLQIAKTEWKEVIERGKEIWEAKLLDHHYTELNNETEKEKKKRKNIIQRILKLKSWNHSF